MKILSFGEILWDVYENEKHIGGAPFNFAAHLTMHGNDVFMLSSLGKDELGEDAIRELKDRNISNEYVSVLENKSTGSCLVELDENQVPTYNLLEDVAYDYISCENISKDFDVLYFGTLALRGEYNYNSLRKLLKTNNFKDIFVDVNIRKPFYSKKTVTFSVSNATVLKISLEELPIVSDILGLQDAENYTAFAKRLSDMYNNLKCIIITCGADGAYALDCKTREEYTCACEDIKVVSTVGAGDSFSAAFLHKYLNGKDIQFCLEYATKISGFVVSKQEAVPAYRIKDFE